MYQLTNEDRLQFAVDAAIERDSLKEDARFHQEALDRLRAKVATLETEASSAAFVATSAFATRDASVRSIVEGYREGVRYAVTDGYHNKIPTIKSVRDVASLSLKDAKDIVDLIYEKHLAASVGMTFEIEEDRL